MTVLTGSRTVKAAPGEAARLFLDWSQDPRWRAQVRLMRVEPPGRAVTGQSIVEELRFAGFTFVTPTRIEHAGDTRASYRGGSAMVSISGTRTVSAVLPDQVRLTATLEVSLRGPLRPLTALLTPSYRRLQEADLDRLATLITRTTAAR